MTFHKNIVLFILLLNVLTMQASENKWSAMKTGPLSSVEFKPDTQNAILVGTYIQNLGYDATTIPFFHPSTNNTISIPTKDSSFFINKTVFVDPNTVAAYSYSSIEGSSGIRMYDIRKYDNPIYQECFPCTHINTIAAAHGRLYASVLNGYNNQQLMDGYTLVFDRGNLWRPTNIPNTVFTSLSLYNQNSARPTFVYGTSTYIANDGSAAPYVQIDPADQPGAWLRYVNNQFFPEAVLADDGSCLATSVSHDEFNSPNASPYSVNFFTYPPSDPISIVNRYNSGYVQCTSPEPDRPYIIKPNGKSNFLIAKPYTVVNVLVNKNEGKPLQGQLLFDCTDQCQDNGQITALAAYQNKIAVNYKEMTVIADNISQ